MEEAIPSPDVDPIEVTPVVVVVQVFPARPSSIPDIRDFVRRCLAESPLTEEGNREVSETVFRALLDAAGPTGSIQVAFRIFPEHVEVDVLHSDTPLQVGSAAAGDGRRPAGVDGSGRGRVRAARRRQDGRTSGSTAGNAAGNTAESGAPGGGSRGAPDGGPDGGSPGAAGSTSPDLAAQGHAEDFAGWMSTALRREGLTQEAAARLLGVSVKTVSRWVGGTTEPRLRDLRRIRDVFGEVPLP